MRISVAAMGVLVGMLCACSSPTDAQFRVQDPLGSGGMQVLHEGNADEPGVEISTGEGVLEVWGGVGGTVRWRDSQATYGVELQLTAAEWTLSPARLDSAEYAFTPPVALRAEEGLARLTLLAGGGVETSDLAGD